MNFHIRLMCQDDTAAGMRLKNAAGWNQTEDDWKRFLCAASDGCFVAESAGQVIATATTIVYQHRVAWIGMVLVDGRMRGRGIGTALLHKAIEHLDAKQIPSIKLDATPQGKPIYERLGFRSEYEIERQVLIRRSQLSGTDTPVGVAQPEVAVLPALPPDRIAAMIRMDRVAFGSDRGALLRSLASAAPNLAISSCGGGELKGFGLGRKGTRADHLGPWEASTATSARKVLATFLLRSQRDLIFVDALKAHPWAPRLLAEKGFEFSRSLTRMYRGENLHPGRPEMMCGILGPEFG